MVCAGGPGNLGTMGFYQKGSEAHHRKSGAAGNPDLHKALGQAELGRAKAKATSPVARTIKETPMRFLN